ncbi:FUSC family protein, partial [Escherichia coli]|uniref:FUSC family protein n=1 Tax=Escherichia coli TaxID=562 RepID=UPI003D9CB7EC
MLGGGQRGDHAADHQRGDAQCGRLIRLSSEFMAMNTRFHALHQLLERLRAQGSTQVLEAFEPCLEEITGLL